MASYRVTLDTIVRRLAEVPTVTGDLRSADLPREVIEPGVSRYQRHSAHLRERVSAAMVIDAGHGGVSIDLTDDLAES